MLHILASDHAITADAGYYDAVNTAGAVARDGWLVTFGIMPTGPETGYGYIAVGEALGRGASKVGRFVEKPNLAKAEVFLAEGGYVWNSGMFMIAARTFVAECESLAPETAEAAIRAVELGKADLDFVGWTRPHSSWRPASQLITPSLKRPVKPPCFRSVSTGRIFGHGTRYGRRTRPTLQAMSCSGPRCCQTPPIPWGAHVVVEGLDRIAVIASEDAIFGGHLPEGQRVGALVKSLKTDPATRALTETHKTTYRPWGGYSSVLMAARFQVKRLFVKPGKKLSLQKHHHRSEHWVVVKGTAEVTIDGTVSTLGENQSIYLPLGCTHRLANPGKLSSSSLRCRLARIWAKMTLYALRIISDDLDDAGSWPTTGIHHAREAPVGVAIDHLPASFNLRPKSANTQIG